MLIKPIGTKQIKHDIFAVRAIISNFYILKTNGSLIAFDTGINPTLTKNGLLKLNLDASNVSHVFLTHSDFDHAGGIKVFKNAKIYLSKMEVPMINGEKPRLLFKYNTKIKDYHTMEDMESIEVYNRKIKLISTPGHTTGSACYLVDDDILITGDTLRTSTEGKVTPFLFLQNMDHNGDKRSLKMLQDEGILDKASIILTGHTGVLDKSFK